MYKSTDTDISTISKSSKVGVIYARFSSTNQRDESIDAQVRACTEYAKHNGIEIVKVYADHAKTGTNSDREQFQQMIKDAEKGQFKYLIIHKLDRFSRSKYDSVVYKHKLKISGVILLSVLEKLDGSLESGVLESLLETIAQYSSENLAREVMKGMKESAYACTHLGGMPPLGYDVDPQTHKYIINEIEAKTIRVIFEKYSDGLGYSQLLAYLNERGYKTKNGNAFGKNSLNSILKNEKYVGRFIFNKKLEKDVSGKRNPQMKPRDEWIIVENGLPAIIDEDTFNKVQAKLTQNLKNGGKHKAKEIYLLSGLIECGECGSSVYCNKRYCGRGKSKYASYRCSNRAQHKGCTNKEIRREYLDNYVLDELYNKLFNDKSIRKLSAMLNEYNRRKAMETNGELDSAKDGLAEVIKKISTIIHLVSESGIEISTVKDELKQLEERKQALEAYIQEITVTTTVSLITEDMIFDLISQSKEFVKTKNISECRGFIENYIEKVKLYHERVEVVFKIHIPDNDTNTVEPLKSEENIKTLQREYKTI
jgi:site-specific DNA recombinase